MNPVRTVAVVILAGVISIAAALPTQAASKVIWADQLIPMDYYSRVHFKMSPGLATSDGGQVELYSPIKLPVGARLKNIKFYFVGAAGASLTVRLVRWRNGHVNVETIFSVTEGGVTGGSEVMSAVLYGDNTVRSNTRYQVLVTLSGNTVGIRNISVTY